jgi:hypothetical protein
MIHFKNLLSSHVRLIYPVILFPFDISTEFLFALITLFVIHTPSYPPQTSLLIEKNATGRSKFSHYTQWDKSPCARVQEWRCTELEVGETTYINTFCDIMWPLPTWIISETYSNLKYRIHYLPSYPIFYFRQVAQGFFAHLYNVLHSFGTMLRVRGILFFLRALLLINKYVCTCTSNKLIMEQLDK